jgi:membrane-associated phospholipid phosphatase
VSELASGAGAPKDPDTRASFWSGHTSLAFAAAAAGGSVAEIRGYAGWPLGPCRRFTAATGTGYLRLAGDRHWLSDVLAAAAGTAVGFVVPWLHRGVTSGGVSASVLPGGRAISGRL